MKNVLIYLFTFLIICFILPAILTKTMTKVENTEQKSQIQEKEENVKIMKIRKNINIINMEK